MINILLDLDQTCISAESLALDGEPAEFDFSNSDQLAKSKLFKYKNMDDYYVVFERPGLQEFLDFLFENFNVSVWTAASKSYALFIIKEIILAGKPERKLDWIFFNYHCKISERKTDNSKDLSLLSELYKFPNYNLDNTIILDDSDEVYSTQTKNCIIAPPFEFKDNDSHKDKFLQDLEEELRKVLLQDTASGTKNAVEKINEHIFNKGYPTHIKI